MPAPDVAVFNPDTNQECPRAIFANGQVINLDECVGELVNFKGSGEFAGYYNDPEATAERMRAGMYWSGDLAYRDEEGWAYFAGRSSDWLRVDGENLAAAPIERILSRHPSVKEAAVYALPDPLVGDQLVVSLTLRNNLTPQEWAAFLAEQPDLEYEVLADASVHLGRLAPHCNQQDPKARPSSHGYAPGSGSMGPLPSRHDVRSSLRLSPWRSC